MQYKYFLFLFLGVFTYSALPQSPEQRASSLFFTPRSRSSSRSFSMAASVARVRAAILSRIARITSKKAAWPAVFAVAGAVKAFAQRQVALPLVIKPDEFEKNETLRTDISDIFKREQSKHLVSRGYSPLAPTTFSQHFEKKYPVERINQLIKNEQLEEQIRKDYFPTLKSEQIELEELEKQEKLLAAQQPTSWWQRLIGQKDPTQKTLAERIQHMQQDVQDQETKLQKIKALIKDTKRAH